MSAGVPAAAPRLRTQWERARAAVAAAADRVEALPVPWVLAAFVSVEWLAVLALARTVRHSGWIYYQGGDQLWSYTLGWLLGHGAIDRTPVGYGMPVISAPISWFSGPNLVAALPAIVLVNVVVLLPAAMLALYGLAARIGGRLFGYWTLLLWVVVPFLGILYTNQGYHQKYTELLLPQTLGLTAMSDYGAMVATLVCLYFSARVVLSTEPRPWLDAAAAGVAAGAAIAFKPSATLMLVGPALALAFTRRFVAGAVLVAGLAPAVLALAVWKERGLGRLPLFSLPALRPAPAGTASLVPFASIDVGHYVHFDWGRFQNNLDLIREHFWSARVIEWMVIAGLIGLARRSRTAALLVGGCFASFAILKGGYLAASIEDGSLFRIMMPAYPAFLLLLASLPLLLPHAPSKLREWRPAFATPAPRVRAALLGVAILFTAVVPLAAFAAADVHHAARPVASLSAGTPPVPVDTDIHAVARSTAGGVVLTWRSEHSVGGPTFYRILRSAPAPGNGITCTPSTTYEPCVLTMPDVGATHATRFVDRPQHGRWMYRVAVAANWLDDPAYGDVYFVSRPLFVTVP